MKQKLGQIVLAVMLAGVGIASAEMCYVVETTDLQKNPAREIKTSAEAKELKKTIDTSARLFPKALELAHKEWDAAEKRPPAAPGAKPDKAAPGVKADKAVVAPSGPIPFPAALLAAPRYLEKGVFTDRDKAQKKVDQLDKLDAELKEDAKTKEEAKAKAADAAKNKSKGVKKTDKPLPSTEKSQAAAIKAAAMVQAKIDELIKNVPSAAGAGEGGGATPAAAPAAAPAEAPKK